ncbi:MAG: undecaprenyldiphospho-muramoylpentapeptide beta-N-acetylglucosaminyltransferase [Bryobacteraceae bacterium]|nr:undecaprenyldiphospho-muramoylpentapeptide beta-N-acetylglucosaminyltransferase [Bryobacteraceae bacterium]
MKFAFAGGGTGGHVIPALAVARELRDRGHEPVFFGTRQGYEARLAPAAGFPMQWIEIGGLNRVGLLRKLRTLLALPLSIWRVWTWMARERPAAVFSMGGYVAGPVVLAAILRGVPVVAMEPNAIPGLTNRRAAPWTTRALVNFEETTAFFKPGTAEVTGVPVRQEFFQIEALRPANPFTVLITGGSQGSRTLNNAGRDSWLLLARQGLALRVIHQAGRGNAAALQDDFVASKLEGEVTEFIEDMPAAFARADLIVSRAGASTVSELAAAGKPSILVPFPFAADDHQLRNAEAMQRAGAARLVLDREMDGGRMFEEIARLVRNRSELGKMAESARLLAKPGAAARAADILEEVAMR